MITRIEIDGFKSFVDFDVLVPPFVAVLGANASGKSNLVDALRAMVDVGEGRVPGAYSFRRGAPTELFHQREDSSRVSEAKLRCDVLVDAPELGGIVGIESQTDIQHRTSDRGERVQVKAAAAGWTPDQLRAFSRRGASSQLMGALETAGKRLETEDHFSDVSGVTPASLYGAPFDSMLDGRQRAMWLLARELRSWHFLSLIPSEIVERAFVTDEGPLETDGSNLAAVLGRLSSNGAMWDLVSDAVALIPGLHNVHVHSNRDHWEFELEFRGTGRMSPRSASDGMLRVLAILAALHDSEYPGVLIVDEIENGLHPARLIELLRRIRARVTDWRTKDELSTPLRQFICTAHSPVVFAELFGKHRQDLVFLSTVFHPWIGEEPRLASLITRARLVGEDGGPGSRVSLGEVRRLLESVQPMEHAQ